MNKAPQFEARFNIAPTSPILVLRDKIPLQHCWAILRWGLVPEWSKNDSASPLLINARAETAATKPSFRSALRRRRCLIPTNGWYEWKRQNGIKQPWFFSMPGQSVFALAGLWESWSGPGGESLESCVILTHSAWGEAGDIHSRMPVMVPVESYDSWLDPAAFGPVILQQLLDTDLPSKLLIYPVSTRVNSPGNNDHDCMKMIVIP